mgnify:CR=1 FL=1
MQIATEKSMLEQKEYYSRGSQVRILPRALIKIMKYFTYIGLILIITNCSIEDVIEDAKRQCEDEIAQAVEEIENICLTKEEVLEIIYSINRTSEQTDVEETF